MTKKSENASGNTEKKYRKARILKDGKFARYTDILNVVLDDNGEYTLDEVMEKTEKFLARRVN